MSSPRTPRARSPGAGIPAQLFADVVPTPLLAFAVAHLGCAAGVMITASHNPPEYNGYKAYWGNGAQIIPPTDVGIAQRHRERARREGRRASVARGREGEGPRARCSTSERRTTDRTSPR